MARFSAHAAVTASATTRNVTGTTPSPTEPISAAAASIAVPAAKRSGGVPPRTVNFRNASDTTGISQEAINATVADKAAGMRTVRVRLDDSVEPLPGIAGRDPATMKGQPVLSIDGNGDVQIINRGGLPDAELRGLINRLRAHGKLE